MRINEIPAAFGSQAMPYFDPQLIGLMRSVLEDVMTRVPAEHSAAAAQGHTSYNEMVNSGC
jgi:hypothetical protein